MSFKWTFCILPSGNTDAAPSQIVVKKSAAKIDIFADLMQLSK